MIVKKTFSYMITPLAPAQPPTGAGALAIPSYYPRTMFSMVQVIRNYRNRGATAAGRSPWSDIFLLVSTEHKKRKFYHQISYVRIDESIRSFRV